MLNGFLPNIFDLAFQAQNFETTKSGSTVEEDPRIVEKLQFHQVQGKRYLGSKTFLQDPQSQFAVRLLLVALEPLRFLTDSWLKNLNSLKAGDRAPLHVLLDPSASPVVAALQRVAGMLMDSQGRGRLVFLWGTAFESFQSWCAIRPEQLRMTRQVLLSLSALVHRRHIVYWEQFPWPLSIVSDPVADLSIKGRDLEKVGWNASMLHETWFSTQSEAAECQWLGSSNSES